MIKIKKKEKEVAADANDRRPTFVEQVVARSRMKIGAPPKRDPRPGERFTIATRVTPELKRRLDAAAAESGRSQAQETELRLEHSFDRTDLLTEVITLAYGRDIAAVLLQLGTLMKARAEATKQVEAWMKDLVLTSRRGR